LSTLIPFPHIKDITRRVQIVEAGSLESLSQSSHPPHHDNDTVLMSRLPSSYSSAPTAPLPSLPYPPQHGNNTVPMPQLPSSNSSAPTAQLLSLPCPLTGSHRKTRSARIERSSLFLYLTAMAAIMFTINILQIVFMPKFRSKAWIQAVPIIIFTVMSIALVAYIIKAYEALKVSWDRAEG
jgi:hypothetical protein